MNKYLKRIAAAGLALFIGASLTGCSDYVMTEEDLAIQKSMIGCWAADDSTGYNSYDEQGNLTTMLVAEFTDDFHYLMHVCDIANDRTTTYEPIAYSIEEGLFKVVKESVPSYAEVSVSEDGQTMFWVTDGGTDKYIRVNDEAIKKLGIPKYDPEAWKDENFFKSESSSDPGESNTESTVSGESTVSEESTAGEESTENTENAETAQE